MIIRSLDQLLEKDDPAWPLVQQWIRAATNKIEVLLASDANRSERDRRPVPLAELYSLYVGGP
jgi:Protein of unknown function DUF2625